MPKKYSITTDNRAPDMPNRNQVYDNATYEMDGTVNGKYTGMHDTLGKLKTNFID